MIDHSLIDAVAHIAHEANRAWSMANGHCSHQAWGDAPEWQRESARQGVLRCLAQPDMTPRMVHDQWARHMSAAGWRHGATKDENARTHPSLVPYEALSPVERARDILFRAVVLSSFEVQSDEDQIFLESRQTHSFDNCTLEQKRPE